MEYYALWVTRNGQHLWKGPFLHPELAQYTLDHLMYCTNKMVIGRRPAN